MLRYVVALADEHHFGRAAARCHVAQSALSQQVKQLETELGVRLFDRTTRHVAITEAGIRLVEHARQVIGASERAAADMRSLAEGRSGSVSVGFVGTATYDVLPRVAHRVRADLPDIDLTLRGELLSPALTAAVAASDLDLALVRPGSTLTPGLHVRHLRTERLVAVLPSTHPLAAVETIDLRALAGETFVLHPSGDRSSIHQQVLAACLGAGFTPPTTLEVGETATLAVFVAAGLGVALVPEPVRSLRLDGVTYVDLLEPPTVDLVLLSRSADRSPAVAAVAAAVLATVTAPAGKEVALGTISEPRTAASDQVERPPGHLENTSWTCD